LRGRSVLNQQLTASSGASRAVAVIVSLGVARCDDRVDARFEWSQV
jgi:hypothetical protein